MEINPGPALSAIIRNGKGAMDSMGLPSEQQHIYEVGFLSGLVTALLLVQDLGREPGGSEPLIMLFKEARELKSFSVKNTKNQQN